MANSVVRLSIDSHEFDANIKRAGEALNKFFDQAKKGDRTFEVLDDDAMEVVRAFGKMETSSKSARGQLSELTKGFTDLSLIYKRLTDEEKASPVGKEMARSLGELKSRIQDTKNDLASINQELSGSKFGQFGGLIDGIGHKMGVSANLTELLTSKTALMTAGIGAAVAAIYKGTEAWTKYNAELSKQDQQTQVITGLDGFAADHMTDTMRALSDTYKVDFRQAVEAANTLMSQFGVNGDEAIRLIKDGMQGMIQGDGPKLLSMIQQYAPAFRDAGVSASQLVAVIHNSEGGIFTDQNMSAIVMGIKNIRLMTNQTSEALAKLGIDGNQMSQQLSNGSLTIFDALKKVASELKNVDSNSKTAGEVMQTVFGRQGAVAGTNIAKAIETLNTNLEETKKQTGELGDAFAELQTANEKLNTAIRECFEYDGWEQMATGIRANLISTLSDVIEKLGEVKSLLAGITPGQARQNKYGTSGTPDEVERDLKALQDADKNEQDEMYRRMLAKYEKRYLSAAASLGRAQRGYDYNENSSNWQGVPFVRKALDRHYWSTRVNTARSNTQVEEGVLAEFRERAKGILNPTEKVQAPSQYKPDPNKPDTQNTKSAARTETQQNEAAIAKLTEEYQNLATAAKTADDAQKAGLTERMTAIRGEIKTLQDRNAELKKFADEAKGVKVSVGAGGSLPQLTKQLKDLQQAQADALTGTVWQQYQQQIEQTSLQIDALKGKWKAGEVATFTIKTDDSELLQKLKDIADVQISDKTLTVTADTAEAYNKVQELVSDIEGREVSIEVKPQAKALPTLDDYRIQAMLEIDAQNTKVDTNTLQTMLADAMKNGIDVSGLGLESIAEQIGKGIDVPTDKWEEIYDGYEELCERIGVEPIKINFETGKAKGNDIAKDMKNDWKDAAGAVQSLGAALQGIEDPAAKVMGIVAQAIATVALTFSKSLAGTVGPWDWIAAAAAGTATMISTITAIKSATAGSYEQGGIIPGNSYTGDRLTANVNSGELILSMAQQDAVATRLTDNESNGGVTALPFVTGEKIVLGVNNWARKTGRGELVFSKR